MTFNELHLHPSLLKALQASGYHQPTPIQEKAIPAIINKKDIVALAPTGSGKTAAFVIPMLMHLINSKPVHKPRILILTPTRELANQITKASDNYGQFLRFKIASILGGMPYRQQCRQLSGALDIVIATPGRLLDHMKQKRIDLSKIEMLILDEADRMLDMGFVDDVKAIAKCTPETRQTLLFSATMDKHTESMIRHLLKEPVQINLLNEKRAPKEIKQSIYFADSPLHKSKLFHSILENQSIFKAIIFSATKINADKLAAELKNMGYASEALHGDLKQSQRNKTLQQLRQGKIQFLIATDVAARGIDISDITHVINYDLPRFSEDYVHRIGRTGRAGKEGTAISFVLPHDNKHLDRIEKYIGHTIPIEVIAGLEPTRSSKKSGSKNPHSKKEHFKKKFKHSKKSSSDFKSNSRKDKKSYSSDFKSNDRRDKKSSSDFKSNDRKDKKSYSSDFKSNDRKDKKSYSSDFKSNDRRDKKSSSDFKSNDRKDKKSYSSDFKSNDRRDKKSYSDFKSAPHKSKKNNHSKKKPSFKKFHK